MNSSQDILIIGGGIIGLSLAVELKLRGASVAVLTADSPQPTARAAAGMLAPQAEQIPPSPMLDLCLQSRALYASWVERLEEITGLKTGYWRSGILAPVCQNDPQQQPLLSNLNSHWLDRDTVRQHQFGLGEEVIGGWWYPDDAQVDNRALFRTLQSATKELQIEIIQDTAKEIIRHGNRVFGVETTARKLQADRYVLAAGPWCEKLLNVPVFPRKGQMLSVCVPKDCAVMQPLQTVLFGTGIYIVPRQDGRIIIGATSENVDFTPGNTPAGIQSLLAGAIKLYPELQNYPILEFWWGFRPATTDELPILGASAWDNLTLATGHYRNGILLAPVTAKLLADLMLNRKLDPLLAAFNYARFAFS
ncbi:MAG: glycine oxidase ThiO [Microcoleus sp. PH2017_01_SCD_O_A]|uniref:glycine oxidase ThiO n=1 Tax=Microcoleus sp. PH2017_01_SCD_O_A TaxID=2798812 RepID=UPI001D76D93D|nr:glycine oxidase ThiO [Microcoleus sp. PH2017_01_SCD_O_A]MCC3420784.1 glycine oxidase ThiO [Microcoleus sp. PH2017_07_MST_O_A]MCC3512725.1 glycine oxidase ThiO [Microcoleus sp. PH2017_17_BER_D_A]TAG63925.1 MAG: glycine oxidase ThiO [Oscillatoriales cyanobacterium]MCC3427995.1 glycine oxidase ThiO [Microcoleus sp. PH2017_01_SCD_O_A]TAH22318.1 MAG: glycine oxidase ThiO [Oscillatoriales cyanobacterium]